jgi:hypothetical protein
MATIVSRSVSDLSVVFSPQARLAHIEAEGLTLLNSLSCWIGGYLPDGSGCHFPGCRGGERQVHKIYYEPGKVINTNGRTMTKISAFIALRVLAEIDHTFKVVPRPHIPRFSVDKPPNGSVSLSSSHLCWIAQVFCRSHQEKM